MFNIFRPQQTTTTVNASALVTEGWLAQERQELQEINQLEREQEQNLQSEINPFEDRQLIPESQNSQPLTKLNLLDALDLITDKIIELKEEASYLQARTEFLQILKICQKRLEKHEEKTFIPILEGEQTDTLRLGKYEITYKPSKKRTIDEKKLEQVLPRSEQFKLFLKPPEFKNIQECQNLLLKLGIYSDVYTTKLGKKPILNIVDTNLIKRKLEEEEQETADEQTPELTTKINFISD